MKNDYVATILSYVIHRRDENPLDRGYLTNVISLRSYDEGGSCVVIDSKNSEEEKFVALDPDELDMINQISKKLLNQKSVTKFYSKENQEDQTDE